MDTSRRINIGDIFYLPLTRNDDITPKGGYESRNKFCFIVGFSEFGYYVVYFLMNSAINSKFINTHDRLSCQYPLSHKDYPDMILPEKDPSYLDLGHVREMEKERVLSEGLYRGSLTSSDLSNILQWLRETDQYSIKQKKRYGWIPQ